MTNVKENKQAFGRACWAIAKRLGRCWPAALACVLAALLLCGGYALFEREIWGAYDSYRYPVGPQAMLPIARSPMKERFLILFPSVREPPRRPAHQAELADDVEVIGVDNQGVARAYVVREMKRPERHVINDRLGSDALTVTYCNIKECVKIYKARQVTPLDLSVAGYSEGMLLRKGNAIFHQDGTPFERQEARLPYDSHPFERTTWGKWRTEHPQTEIVRLPESPLATG